MFGLPLETVAILGAVSIFWIAYTFVFLYRSRNWSDGAMSETVEG